MSRTPPTAGLITLSSRAVFISVCPTMDRNGKIGISLLTNSGLGVVLRIVAADCFRKICRSIDLAIFLLTWAIGRPELAQNGKS